MTSWSATEITTRIVDAADKYSPRNPQQLKQLHTALCHADPKEVYFGIMAVFRIPRFGPQEVAGRLLMGIKPRPREPLESIVRNSLATWDLSVEELPWYLAEKFGAKEILSTLDALETESTRSDQELVAIRSFRFWLPKCPTDAQPIIPPDLSRQAAPGR
jgi:hypothetical protein